MPENWTTTRDHILRRDDMTCLRCGKKHRYKKHLNVHHMLPRSEGGTEEPTNLVTLCEPCHDYVEINGLRTRADIIGSYEEELHLPGIIEIDPDDDTPEDDWRPSWHKYVYGGVKKE